MFARKPPRSWRGYQGDGERRAKSRQRMQAIGAVCVMVVLATFAAVLTWELWREAVR